jgi:large subunit ribosomal protein L22
MKVCAKLNYLRIAPRKVRLLADLARGKDVKDAQVVLNFVPKKGSLPLLKLLNQAVTNARNNFQIESDNLYISKITVDEGPKYKRWRARSRGQAYEIQKKTCHITLILDERIKTKKKIGEKVKKTTKIKKAEEKKIRPKISRPKPELTASKPKVEKGIKKIFRRKAF